MWLLACNRAGLHIPIEISPSLKLTLLPPNAFKRDEAGKLINENTDLPALETCAVSGQINHVQSAKNTLYLRKATLPQNKSPAKLLQKNHICKCFGIF